jgi:eukaryotic-like serine/threonine-protein kinase
VGLGQPIRYRPAHLDGFAMSEPDPATRTADSQTQAWTSDPAFQTTRDLTGTTLGDFHVERRLGRGGMGEVYLATQVSLNRSVALKVLRPDLLANPKYLSRFEAEAWAAAKLNHPNIVHIYTLGCIDAVRFIAMEYVQGTNLREYIERKGPPEMPLALAIMRQSAQAVGAAGESGLVHRDIKPENLLLTRKGQVKVADFGLCRDKEGPALNLTQPGVTMGTPMYMSPEQVQGYALDHRSDLYSLGVTFYHMLAGSPPFRAESAIALALKHVRDEPVSLKVHRPDLPPELVALVMKLLAKDPSERYPSAAELLRDISRIKEALNASSVPLSVTMPPAAPGPTALEMLKTEVAPATEGTRPSLRDQMRGVRVGGTAMTAVVLLSLVAGALGGWFGRADDLLAEGVAAPKGPPGLWMAPWDQIPQQPSAIEQYRYALIQAPEANQEAAWLAVPGRFATNPQWASNAYIQLARYLFRHHDATRLEVLAAELERSRYHEQKKLARFARGAALALRNDPDGMLDVIDNVDSSTVKATNTMDVGLAEFCLEIVIYTKQTPAGSQHPTELNKLQRALMQTLRLDFLEGFDFAAAK